MFFAKENVLVFTESALIHYTLLYLVEMLRNFLASWASTNRPCQRIMSTARPSSDSPHSPEQATLSARLCSERGTLVQASQPHLGLIAILILTFLCNFASVLQIMTKAKLDHLGLSQSVFEGTQYYPQL